VLAEGHAVTECPRWHEGQIYYSDMHGQAVYVVADGTPSKLVDLPGTPGGLGWLPDGTLLIVVQDTRAIYRFRGGKLELHADLTSSGTTPLNDMLVLPSGRAYVGEMGFDVHAFLAAAKEGRSDGPPFAFARLLLVEPDGTHRPATDSVLMFPNGIVAVSETELLVAESFGFKITSCALGDDGVVSGTRLWAQLEFAPDGISLDEDGHLWVADPDGRRAVLVAEGGAILDEVPTGTECLSVALGGETGSDLALCTTAEKDPKRSIELMSSQVQLVSLSSPHAVR
jgi:sugar lactone lactonase YvrE